jgi:hypothetical protein
MLFLLMSQLLGRDRSLRNMIKSIAIFFNNGKRITLKNIPAMLSQLLFFLFGFSFFLNQ